MKLFRTALFTLLFVLSGCKTTSQSSDLNATNDPVGLCGDNFCLTAIIHSPSAFTFAVRPLSENNNDMVVTAIKYLNLQGDEDPDTSYYKSYRIYRLYDSKRPTFFKDLMTDLLKLPTIKNNASVHDEIQRLANNKELESYVRGYKRYSLFRGTLQILINALAERHNNEMKEISMREFNARQVLAVDLTDFVNGKWRTWGENSLLYPKTRWGDRAGDL